MIDRAPRTGRAKRRLARRWPARSLESLERRLLMHANPVEDAEHLAVFGARDAVTGIVTGGLVPDAAVTDTNIGNGKWSDATNWTNGVPKDGDNVLIKTGTTVTVDGMEDKDASAQRDALRTIRVDGTLRFDPNVNTRLLVDTIIVEPSGSFVMGTDPTLPDANSPTGKGQPIAPNVKADVTFADRGPIDLNWDPLQFSRGLVSHGAVSIFGTEVTSFVAAAGDPVSGATLIGKKATQITLVSVPSNWKAGDRLIITGNTATNSAGVNQDEQVAIQSITGNVVTFTDPNATKYTGLKFDHTAPAGASIYVADVTRNAVFESENISVVAQRGHLMFMHSDNVHIDAVGFYGLGRTDKRNPIDDPVLTHDPDFPNDPTKMTTDVIDSKTGQRVLVPVVDANGNPVYLLDANGNKIPVLDSNGNPVLNPDKSIQYQVKTQIARTGLNPRGRYAVHFHRAGTEPNGLVATVNDSAVVDSPGWGMVNHSSDVIISNNVVFNAVGAAYVTEAGDEVGSFTGNIAIHSQGSGAGIEDRKNIGDFGHEGVGFWLQGGNVSLIGNIATGQRSSGFVFFPVGLNQKGLGVTQIEAVNLVDPTWAGTNAFVADGDVPLRQFQGNVAFADGDGFESWFSLLNVSDGRRTVVQDFLVWNSGGGIFTPYTNQITFKNVTVLGNLKYPGGTAFNRNDVTRNVVYDHVNVQGWNVGINAPVNGTNVINAGTFNNLKNILITTANSRDRVVDINDDPTDSAHGQVAFLDNLVDSKKVPLTQFDVYLQSNFNPMEQDITRLFNPDVIRMGTVRHNGVQLYYNEQAADFVPFPAISSASGAPVTAPYIPAQLLGLTNQQIFNQFGLAIGGIIAPANATRDPKINGLIGAPSTYQFDLQLLSRKYTRYATDHADYLLVYKYFDPTNPKHDKAGYVTVKETAPTQLSAGWNLLTRTILGATRTLLVYGDDTAPTFALGKDPLIINKADLDNGSTYYVSGTILDDSFGSKHFETSFKLSDATHVSPLFTENGVMFVNLMFTITDLAGNATLVTIKIQVTTDATLIKDIGRKNLPIIMPSVTLIALVGHT
jgi:hypothetical protein